MNRRFVSKTSVVTRFRGLLIYCGFLVVSLTNTSASCAEFIVDAESFTQYITVEKVKRDIAYLASQELEGRGTGSRGERLAANYIARRFRLHQLIPPSGQANYIQTFRVYEREMGETNSITVKTEYPCGLIEERFSYPEVVPLGFSSSGKVKAPIVFAGYGIVAPEHDYNDYACIDVKGKIVLILRHEPRELEEAGVFGGKQMTTHAYIKTKLAKASTHGAAAILIVTDPLNHKDFMPDLAPFAPYRFKLSRRSPPRSLTLAPIEGQSPIAQINKNIADEILEGTGWSLANLQERIDKSLQPNSFEISGKVATIDFTVKDVQKNAHNVIGILEGRDPDFKNECIIIGAHLDHLGISVDRGTVFLGADDNASGVSGLLSIVAAFDALGLRPRRTIVFVGFSGEEYGLWGSRYYAENPIIPMSKTIGMVNLDMIGRLENRAISVSHSDFAPKLETMIKEIGAELNVKVDVHPIRPREPSDHSVFHNREIPSVHLFAGFHADYHTPADTADKLTYAGIVSISSLAAMLVWKIAEQGLHLN